MFRCLLSLSLTAWLLLCRVEAALEHWRVTGLQQRGTVPSLIASVGESSSSLLSVMFELNPEESSCDQMLKIHSQPVEIIYDAVKYLGSGSFSVCPPGGAGF